MGCPTRGGGRWPANDYLHNQRGAGRMPGSPSKFALLNAPLFLRHCLALSQRPWLRILRRRHAPAPRFSTSIR